MRRRNITRKHPEVELFPFLSILACTIGTLILLIIVLTTQALNQQEVVIVAKEENGANANKSPRYIETRSDGIILYPSKEFIPQEQLEEPNSPLQKLIAEVKANRDREYLIVALRPNAIDVFLQVRNILEEAKIDIGYEPLDAGWTLKTEEEVEIKNE